MCLCRGSRRPIVILMVSCPAGCCNVNWRKGRKAAFRAGPKQHLVVMSPVRACEPRETLGQPGVPGNFPPFWGFIPLENHVAVVYLSKRNEEREMNMRYPIRGPSRAALLKWAGAAAKLIFGCLLVAGGLRLLAQ